MEAFAQLYDAIQATRSTREKVAEMVAYFSSADASDAAVAAFLLSGRRLKRLIPPSRLRAFCAQRARLPGWLVSECHAHVGDLAETLNLLLPAGSTREQTDLASLFDELRSLEGESEALQLDRFGQRLGEMSGLPRMLFLKLVTGGLRVGVSEKLLATALARTWEQPEEAIAQLLLGAWEPTPDFIERLREARSHMRAFGPRPFCLASPLEQEPAKLGAVEDFLLEWKWDGIRAQLILEEGTAQLWSRGEAFVSAQFPEILLAARQLREDCILDGEILAWSGDGPLPFAALQRRLNRKQVGARLLKEVPVAFVAYDLLQKGTHDHREEPLEARRATLAALLAETSGQLRLSSPLSATDWADVATLRTAAPEARAEGIMLKARQSPYTAGRKRGIWWKWKVDPFSADLVLTGAELGSGRRANLYTDYTFSVAHEGELLPVAKAYSGLTDEEILQVDRWIRAHIRGKFGPVRTVEPHLVFELHFEGIARSSRHKSGVALRFPRIHRWRRDKPLKEIDQLANLLALIEDDAGQRPQKPPNDEQLELF